jgi:hypothetical protein
VVCKSCLGRAVVKLLMNVGVLPTAVVLFHVSCARGVQLLVLAVSGMVVVQSGCCSLFCRGLCRQVEERSIVWL